MALVAALTAPLGLFGGTGGLRATSKYVRSLTLGNSSRLNRALRWAADILVGWVHLYLLRYFAKFLCPPTQSNLFSLCKIPTVATISAGGAPSVGGRTLQQAPKPPHIFTKKRVAPSCSISSLKFSALKPLIYKA
jgi:hypothetical protein